MLTTIPVIVSTLSLGIFDPDEGNADEPDRASLTNSFCLVWGLPPFDTDCLSVTWSTPDRHLLSLSMLQCGDIDVEIHAAEVRREPVAG